jgi:LmbE family N-acetylglucosaminyl deacetylase
VSDPLGTVLGVWAHPDDESYLCAGLMARTAAAGERVVCVTATRGELGSTDEARWPPGPSLAAVRTAELAEALRILGPIEHHFLDYPDGGCAEIDDSIAVARLRRIVEDVGPDTVLTFGPDGQTGHDDHRAVCRWTSAAVQGCAATLHYSTNTPGWVERFGRILEEAGASMGEKLPVTPLDDLSIRVDLDGVELDRKFSAMLAQISQVSPMLDVFGAELYREAIAEEVFRLAP